MLPVLRRHMRCPTILPQQWNFGEDDANQSREDNGSDDPQSVGVLLEWWGC